MDIFDQIEQQRAQQPGNAAVADAPAPTSDQGTGDAFDRIALDRQFQHAINIGDEPQSRQIFQQMQQVGFVPKDEHAPAENLISDLGPQFEDARRHEAIAWIMQHAPKNQIPPNATPAEWNQIFTKEAATPMPPQLMGSDPTEVKYWQRAANERLFHTPPPGTYLNPGEEVARFFQRAAFSQGPVAAGLERFLVNQFGTPGGTWDEQTKRFENAIAQHEQDIQPSSDKAILGPVSTVTGDIAAMMATGGLSRAAAAPKLAGAAERLAMGAVGGAQAGGQTTEQTYQELLQLGVPDADARKSANLAGGIAGVVGAATSQLFAGNPAESIASHVPQETVQQAAAAGGTAATISSATNRFVQSQVTAQPADYSGVFTDAVLGAAVAGGVRFAFNQFNNGKTAAARQEAADRAAGTWEKNNGPGLDPLDARARLDLPADSKPTESEITKAWRAAVQRAHPDAGGAADGSDFKAVMAARATLLAEARGEPMPTPTRPQQPASPATPAAEAGKAPIVPSEPPIAPEAQPGAATPPAEGPLSEGTIETPQVDEATAQRMADELLKKLNAQPAEPTAVTEPVKPQAPAEPDLSNATFEDAKKPDAVTDQRIQEGAAEKPAPAEPAKTTLRPYQEQPFKTHKEAIAVAKNRAAILGQPVFVVHQDDGTFKLDQRAPESGRVDMVSIHRKEPIIHSVKEGFPVKGKPPGDVERRAASSAAAPAEIFVHEATTGKAASLKGFRGTGRSDREAAYTIRGSAPVLGDGKYFAIEKAGATGFGPKVVSESVQLRNPLVIDSDEQWRKLAKEAGWEFPNPVRFGDKGVEQMNKDVAAMRSVLEKRGHDGVIVRLSDKGDATKTLGKVFGVSQIVQFKAAGEKLPAIAGPQEPMPGMEDAVKRQEFSEKMARAITKVSPGAEADDVQEAVRGVGEAMQSVEDEAAKLRSIPDESKIRLMLSRAVSKVQSLKSRHPDVKFPASFSKMGVTAELSRRITNTKGGSSGTQTTQAKGVLKIGSKYAPKDGEGPAIEIVSEPHGSSSNPAIDYRTAGKLGRETITVADLERLYEPVGDTGILPQNEGEANVKRTAKTTAAGQAKPASKSAAESPAKAGAAATTPAPTATAGTPASAAPGTQAVSGKAGVVHPVGQDAVAEPAGTGQGRPGERNLQTGDSGPSQRDQAAKGEGDQRGGGAGAGPGGNVPDRGRAATAEAERAPAGEAPGGVPGISAQGSAAVHARELIDAGFTPEQADAWAAKVNAPAAQATNPTGYSSGQFYSGILDLIRAGKINLSIDQLFALHALTDARATTWAKFANRAPSEWYGTHLAGIAPSEPGRRVVIFQKDGRAIIQAAESADLSTLIYAMGRIFLRDLVKLQGESTRATLDIDISKLEKWAGVEDGNWTKDAEDKFAAAFGRWLREGKTIVEALKAVFQNFRRWLSSIYTSLKGSPIDVKINDKVREVLDRMVEGDIKARGEEVGIKPTAAVPAPTLPANVTKIITGGSLIQPAGGFGFAGGAKSPADFLMKLIRLEPGFLDNPVFTIRTTRSDGLKDIGIAGGEASAPVRLAWYNGVDAGYHLQPVYMGLSQDDFKAGKYKLGDQLAVDVQSVKDAIERRAMLMKLSQSDLWDMAEKVGAKREGGKFGKPDMVAAIIRAEESKAAGPAADADDTTDAEARAATSRGPDDAMPGSLSPDAPDEPDAGEMGSGAGSGDLGAPKPPTKARIAVAPLPGGTSKKLRDIQLDFTDLLKRSKVYTANPGRRFGGVYGPGNSKIIIRSQGNLDTTAHEVGHFLDDKFGLVAPWARARAKSPYDKELIPDFSGYGSVTKSGRRSRLWYQRAEGVAEWLRAFIVNPEAAQKAAPLFHAHYMKTVPPEFRAAVQAFSDDVRKFAGMPAHKQMLANVNAGPGERDRRPRGIVPKAADLFTNGAMGLREQLQDAQYPILRAIAEVLKVRTDLGPLQARNNPALLLRLLAGMPSQVKDAIDNGPPKAFTADQRADDVEGGIDWMVEPLKGKDLAETNENLADGLVYLVARRVKYKADLAREAANQSIAMLDPADPDWAAQVQSILDRLANKLAQPMTGAGAGLFRDVAQGEAAVRELAKATPDRIRDLEEFARRYEATAKGNLTYLKDMGRISKESYNAILENNEVYADMHRLIEELEPGLGQRMGKTLSGSTKIIQRFKGGSWMIENPLVNLMSQTQATIMEANRNYFRQKFNDLLIVSREMYGPDLRDLARFGTKVTDAKNAITTYNKGKGEKWVYRSDIERVMRSVEGVSDFGVVFRALSAVTRGIPQKAITTTIPFVIRQLFKDALHRVAVTRSESKVSDVLKPQEPGLLERYQRAGGSQASLYYSPDAYRDLLKQAIKELSGEKKTIVTLPGRLWDWWNDKAQVYGDQRNRLVEMRAAEKKLIDAGVDPYDAMLAGAGEARDLIDFNVAGRAIRPLMPFVLFINPAIQAPFRVWRAAAENPKRLGVMFLKYILLPHLAIAFLRWLMGDDDEYQQLPAWRRDLFINFKVGGYWISIPQPQELAIFGALAERMVNAARGQEHALEGLLGSAASSLSPVDELGVGGLWRAMVENTANWQFYFKQHIVPDWEAGKDLVLRDTSRASRMGQMLQDVLGVDARYIENTLYAEFGNWATLATQLSDLGREDRNPTRFISSIGGMGTDTPIYNARDVQWVMKESARLGLDESKDVKQLRALLHAAVTAPSLPERNDLADQARSFAGEMRKYLEENGEGILEDKAAKERENEADRGE